MVWWEVFLVKVEKGFRDVGLQFSRLAVNFSRILMARCKLNYWAKPNVLHFNFVKRASAQTVKTLSKSAVNILRTENKIFLQRKTLLFQPRGESSVSYFAIFSKTS